MSYNDIRPGKKTINASDIEAEYSDLIEEYEDLCNTRDEAYETMIQADENDDVDKLTERYNTAQRYVDDWKHDNLDDLMVLRTVLEEIRDYSNFNETLISEDYFPKYAKEYAEDMGFINTRGFAGITWPLTCIDWDVAADELKEDFTEIDYHGHTYYILTR